MDKKRQKTTEVHKEKEDEKKKRCNDESRKKINSRKAVNSLFHLVNLNLQCFKRQHGKQKHKGLKQQVLHLASYIS